MAALGPHPLLFVQVSSQLGGAAFFPSPPPPPAAEQGRVAEWSPAQPHQLSRDLKPGEVNEPLLLWGEGRHRRAETCSDGDGRPRRAEQRQEWGTAGRCLSRYAAVGEAARVRRARRRLLPRPEEVGLGQAVLQPAPRSLPSTLRGQGANLCRPSGLGLYGGSSPLTLCRESFLFSC